MPLFGPPVTPPAAQGGVAENAQGKIVSQHSLPFQIVGELQPDGSTRYSIKVINAQGQEVVIHAADL